MDCSPADIAVLEDAPRLLAYAVKRDAELAAAKAEAERLRKALNQLEESRDTLIGPFTQFDRSDVNSPVMCLVRTIARDALYPMMQPDVAALNPKQEGGANVSERICRNCGVMLSENEFGDLCGPCAAERRERDAESCEHEGPSGSCSVPDRTSSRTRNGSES
jgi:hypothetical protein